MTRRRDRHDRGLRGAVIPMTAQGRSVTSLRRHPNNETWFETCVTESLQRVVRLQPGLLDQIEVGIEEVPTVRPHDTRVPLAAAIEGSALRGGAQPARVVIYRRPLEQRSSSRTHLRRLVHRTVVEQLAVLTNRTVADIDPQLDGQDDDPDDD